MMKSLKEQVRDSLKKSPSKSKVKTVMHEFKHGTLHSGGSGKKVTNPKQAIAIAMSEARRHPNK